MKEALENLSREAVAEIKSVNNIMQLENLRVKYLGKKGNLTEILKGLGKLSCDERPIIGKLANEVKESIAGALDAAVSILEEKRLQDEITKGKIDITLPGKIVKAGKIHPVTQITREIKEIFIGMGFSVAEGPEVESEYYNFESLNIPADHPSRDMWDSFYFGDGNLLRSHTSPVQVRTMEKAMKTENPSVRVLALGKCYRRDAVDATHHWMFNQCEGLLVDKGVTFADLKGILLEFARRMFGEKRRTKFIPSYFPFTEPSAEMAVDCFICEGQGCRVCKKSGWIEIMGAGMVNPKVLEGVGYDPEIYTGFAFGMGVERIAMLKHDIGDIRLLTENDLRFLGQF